MCRKLPDSTVLEREPLVSEARNSAQGVPAHKLEAEGGVYINTLMPAR